MQHRYTSNSVSIRASVNRSRYRSLLVFVTSKVFLFRFFSFSFPFVSGPTRTSNVFIPPISRWRTRSVSRTFLSIHDRIRNDSSGDYVIRWLDLGSVFRKRTTFDRFSNSSRLCPVTVRVQTDPRQTVTTTPVHVRVISHTKIFVSVLSLFFVCKM